MEADLYQQMRTLEDEHWWFVARRKIIASVLKTLQLPAGAEILEVGCGTGGNIPMLQRFGSVIGIEHDESAAGLARQRNIAPILAGELPHGLPAFPGRFDVIALFDVIEHIEQDLESLVALSALLNPGGRMIITVPAFNFLWSRHDDENQHKRRYRRRTLVRLAGQSGLRLHYLSYFNTWLFPPVAAVRLFRKLFPYEESWKDMHMPAALVNQLLQKIFSSERYLIGRASLPFGISLIAVMAAPDSA